MASVRTWSAHGATLMFIGVWGVTAGNIFADPPEKVRDAKSAKAALLGVPLNFEANQGQTDSRVKFLSHGDGYSLFLTPQEAVFTLRPQAGAKAPPTIFRLQLRGANPAARVTGADKLPGISNYYLGNDPKKWRRGIATYGKVKYERIYPGVDAVFYGNQRQLEYDFVVAPGADPRQISLGLTGSEPRLDADGNVVLKLTDGGLTLKRPVAYQNIGGEKKRVDARYILAGHKVRFRLGEYDHNQTLVIDPVFTYLTYLGGSSVDRIGSITGVGQVYSPNQALAIDSAGNVYVAGETLSTDFPLVNAYQSTAKTPGYTAFVSALNSTGTALLYSTYLGGSVSNGGNPGSDIASSIAWDSFDNAVYVVGTATNSDFPTTSGAFQPKNPNGQYLPFVAKFGASGQLAASTFLGAGAAGYEYGLGVAADSLGQAYIVGFTSYINCTSQSSLNCFPTTSGAVIPSYNTVSTSDYGNGFVSVLNPSLSTLLYSTLLGDPNGASVGYGTQAFGVTVDSNGNFYVVGQTGSAALPVTSGAFQKTLLTSNGIPVVGFAAKFGPVSAKGASLLYLTYLEATGQSFTDIATGVAADSQGNAYVGGYTHSPTFPVTSGAIQSICDPNSFPYNCAFVAKLNPTGTGLVWSTFVEPASFLTAIQIDTQGNVYVAGNNNGFFQAVNAVEPNLNQGGAFVAKLNPAGSALLFSSLIGGTDGVGSLAVTGLAVDAPGNIYIAGYTGDTTFPTTPGAFQTALKNPGTGNSLDGYIGKISLAPSISGIVPNDSSISTIAAGEWVSIYGANFTGAAATWTGNFPISLGGVSVTIDGSQAYLWYVSPTQINLQVPKDAATGPVTVVVTGPNGTASSTVTLAQFAPAFDLLDTKHVAGIILRSNGSGAYGGGSYDIIGPTGNSLGYATVAAKAGDIIELFGGGFGPTSPSVAPGVVFSGAAATTNAVSLSINKVAVTPSFAGLSAAGLYQINFTVPAGLGTGDVSLAASVGGVTTQPGVVISVQ